LVDNDDLVCAIRFNNNHKYGWEINRYSAKLNTSVVGGTSKMLKYFKKIVDPDVVVAYADRRYSFGVLYTILGFEFDGITDPMFCYVKNNNVYSRQYFQEHKLDDRIKNFDHNLSVEQNMFNNDYRRLWDAGHFRFIWRK